LKPSVVIIERAAIVLASLVLSIGLIALLSGFFAGRDQSAVSSPSDGPGQQFADQGHAILRPGEAPPKYNSDPPTSGAHVPILPQRNNVALNDNELLQALQLGDVVIMYQPHQKPPGLSSLVAALASPFSPSLAQTGQAVIVAPRPGTSGVVGLAWAHMLRVNAPDDPSLAQFVQFWLGKGAAGR
jgi:hypothetical protein